MFYLILFSTVWREFRSHNAEKKNNTANLLFKANLLNFHSKRNVGTFVCLQTMLVALKRVNLTLTLA
jgi:hypothetical protein